MPQSLSPVIEMSRMLGYGEDALTLWALENRLAEILKHFGDKTSPSDCLIFYRPSFGRSGGKDSSEFGEFDAIVASPRNIYLVESKWDGLSRAKRNGDLVKPVQKLRHSVFSWYLTNWTQKYKGKWLAFKKKKEQGFRSEFKDKRIPRTNTLLSKNLESIMRRLQKRCKNPSEGKNIKNVLLYFYNGRKRPRLSNCSFKGFEPVIINYSRSTSGNFITLD